MKKKRKLTGLELKEWNRTRMIVLTRDGFKCRHDKCTNDANQIHHVIPFREKEENNILNLVSLCEKHHAIADNTYFKYGRTSQVDIWLRDNYKFYERSRKRIEYRKNKKIKPGTKKKK